VNQRGKGGNMGLTRKTEAEELALLRDCIDGFLKIPIEQKWFILGYMQGRLAKLTTEDSIYQESAEE
jgi:hypothetical protein